MGMILDLSRWQYDIDFSKLAAAYKSGIIDGVILRVQHGYTTPDEKYTTYVAGCKANGIPFGTYAYAAPVSVNDAIAEANSAFQRTDSASQVFIVDIEEVTTSDLVAAGQAYVDRLHALGMKNVGVYSGEYFYQQHGLGAIKCDWTWIAKYGANDGTPHVAPVLPEADLWQFTSVGHIDGISTNVDESVVTSTADFKLFIRQPIATPASFVMQVKVLQETDVRDEPSHTSGYVKDALKDEIYNIISVQNDWHLAALSDTTTGWIDGNNGQNLYWLDNPALKQSVPVYYYVKSGDTLSKIAAANNTTTAQLVSWNNLTDANVIYVGQKLKVK